MPIDDIPGSFRPDVLPLVLQELETSRALGLADLAEHNREVAIRNHSASVPGGRLEILAIGVGEYRSEHAADLRLTYAARDARDLASALVDTQRVLYAKVAARVLLNKEATRTSILNGLETMRSEMAGVQGNDLAIVHFSGSTALLHDRVYLLPSDVDTHDAAAILSTALSVNEFANKLLELAKLSRVLVLLDAPGVDTAIGPAAADSTALRSALAAPNVTVLTSTSGGQVSLPAANWQHGAFTQALLDALSDPSADVQHDGLIRTTDLGHYVIMRVASTTNGRQTPGIDIRYDSVVFASGL